MRRPRLALVPGEPGGIGPELCVRALQARWPADLVVHGDADTLCLAAGRLGLPLAFPDGQTLRTATGDSAFVAIRNAVPTRFGTADPANARSVIDALHVAGQACLSGNVDGLVTGPVHKASINAGGVAFTGTTELLARQAGCDVVMMLANDTLRVALATTHLPLRAVADAVTQPLLERVLRITHRALRNDFGIGDPHVAVLGLNPHAGEEGHLGREEIEVLAPVLARLRGEGLRLSGPLPADTAFLPAQLAGFDAVVAMYHDQGLPVLKFSGFEQAVNLTLGLPYPRVAVDHGTALALAGKGSADPSSLFAAITTCAQMSRARRSA